MYGKTEIITSMKVWDRDRHKGSRESLHTAYQSKDMDWYTNFVSNMLQISVPNIDICNIGQFFILLSEEQ
jgi:hypothetical protein